MAPDPSPPPGRWQRAPGVLCRHVAGSLVLAHCAGGEPLVVNRSGSLVWQLLDEPATTAELAGLLATATAMDETTLAEQIDGLLVDLAGRGFAERT